MRAPRCILATGARPNALALPFSVFAALFRPSCSLCPSLSQGAHCIDCKRPASMYAVQAAVYDDSVCTCDACGGLVKPDIVVRGLPHNA